MKKIILLLFIATIFTYSCEKSIHGYKGEEGIYIDGASMNDSISISFAYMDNDITEYDYTFKVNTMGDPVNHDRTFKIERIAEINPEEQAIEGVDYKSMHFGEYIMPAGKAYLEITIKFYRTEALLTGSRKLSFKLSETPDFKFLFNRTFESNRYITNPDLTIDTITYTRYIDIQRCIKISEGIGRQSWWPMPKGHADLGSWSVQKSLLICDVLNLNRQKWLTNDQLGITSPPYIAYIGRAMQLYLNENPVHEADTLMKMGPNANY